jgi:hypothetical protein
MALGGKLREARMRMNLTPSQAAAATRMKVQLVEALEREDFSHIAAPIYGKGFIKLYAELVGLYPKPLVDEYVRSLGAPRTPLLVSEEEPPAKPAPPKHDLAAFTTDKFTPPAGETIVLKEEEPQPPAPAAQAPAEPAREQAKDLELFAHAETRAAQPAREQTPEEEPDEFRYRPGRQAEGRQADLWTRRAQAATAAGEPAEGKARRPWSGLSEFPLRTVALLAGVALVVIFLASGLSRCARRPARGPVAPPSPAVNVAEPLRTAVPLPDPYVD